MDGRDLVKLGLSTYLRTLRWGATRVLGQDGMDRLRDELRKALNIPDAPAPAAPAPDIDQLAVLKERGAELLAGDGATDGPHPSYELILDSLVPDEARILRLLAVEGAQANVDVRNRKGIVATGLNRVGDAAKVQRVNRTPAYLSNLNRLGLTRASREPIDDERAYATLENSDEVQEALRDAGRGRTIRGAIRLTPFGRDFCETCLPIDTAGFLAIQDDVRTSRSPVPPPPAR